MAHEQRILRLAAFAIENNVDFEAFTIEPLRDQLARKHPPFSKLGTRRRRALPEGFCTAILPLSNNGQRPSLSAYFERVSDLMKQALQALVAQPGGAEWLREVDSVVVSTPGVIENHQTVLQLNLWDWDTEKYVRWRGNIGFNVRTEIKRILRTFVPQYLDKAKVEEIADKVYVVNDATACAAFYDDYHRDFRRKKQPDFIYLKAHDGFNVGVIEQGNFFPSRAHPEYGHIYPILHRVDLESGLKGTCAFHGKCIEGVTSLRSLLERARLDQKRGVSPRGWGDILTRIEKETSDERVIERALFKTLLPKKGEEPSNMLAVDIIAHYLAQVVHQLILSPVSPDRIVIGGRFARPAVIESVIQKLQRALRDYPARRNLEDVSGLRKLIQIAPEAKDILRSKSQMEVYGAAVMGYGFACSRPGGHSSSVSNVIMLGKYKDWR